MIGSSYAAADWHPRIARAEGMAHTWVPCWENGDVEAIVTEAHAEHWEYLIIESTHFGPLADPARAAVIAVGATLIGPDPTEIAAALAAVDERLKYRLDHRRQDRPPAEQRRLLLLVGDGDHILNDTLYRVAVWGRAADVHLAIDDRACRRTPRQFDDNVCGVYHHLATA